MKMYLYFSIKGEWKASFIVQKSHTVSGHANNPGPIAIIPNADAREGGHF